MGIYRGDALNADLEGIMVRLREQYHILDAKVLLTLALEVQRVQILDRVATALALGLEQVERCGDHTGAIAQALDRMEAGGVDANVFNARIHDLQASIKGAVGVTEFDFDQL